MTVGSGFGAGIRDVGAERLDSKVPRGRRPFGPGVVRSRLLRCLGCVVLAAALAASAPGAQDDGSLQAIRREVERLREELARFDERQLGVLGSLERLSLERLLLEEEIRALEQERAATERAAADARAASEELRVRLEAQRGDLAWSLRQAYKLGRLRQYRLMLDVADPDDLARAYRYISEWSRADAARIADFRRTAADLERQEAALQARLADLARLLAGEAERREGLERNRVSHEESLRRLDGQRQARREAVKELEEAAGRLEALVASLPEGERLPVDGRLVDLESLRGFLPWPAAGKVVVPYGEVRHPRFRTVTPHPGIDIAVAEGSPVRPVFGGRVVYADWFRGYGNTVIVDHGRGTVSVYAHLRRPDVRVGDAVDPSTPLGLSGSTGSLAGPMLYFEIRHQGRTEDPLLWLRPEP